MSTKVCWIRGTYRRGRVNEESGRAPGGGLTRRADVLRVEG